jgi:DNA primase
LSFSPQFLEQLRERISLAAVVGRHVRLTKRGRDFVGLCPFHNEKTPSFNVVEEKGFYHCFGCGAHGDVIGFTMRVSNLPFREAVEELAKAVGVELPHESPRDRERARQVASLYDVLEAACVWFELQLAAPSALPVMRYIAERGIQADARKDFRLGFAPDGRNLHLFKHLNQSFSEALIVEAGLVRTSAEGERFDFFRGRLIFPIADRNGRVVAFGGRILGDGQPKYLNSPESPVFQKSRTLYGYHLARKAIAPDHPAIVSEGYTDVIALHQSGFKTAVAPLGTALTEDHIAELWRASDEPILCFDGDAAGQRAANRALNRALPLVLPQKSLRFVTLEKGDDPDSLLRREGPRAMEAALQAGTALSEFLWRMETRGKTLNTAETLARVRNALEERINLITHKGMRESFRSVLLFQRLFREFKSAKPRGGKFKTEAQSITSPGELNRFLEKHGRQSRVQFLLLATAINHPSLLLTDVDRFVHLQPTNEEVQRICAEILKVIATKHEVDSADLYSHLRAMGFEKVLRSIFASEMYRTTLTSHPHAPSEEASLGWEALFNRLYTYDLRSDVEDSEAALARAMGDKEWEQLRHRLVAYISHDTEEALMERLREKVALGAEWRPPVSSKKREEMPSVA